MANMDFSFAPELRLLDGRILRGLDDAIDFARAQETRPGVDQRDEVLHRLERAQGEHETREAADMFVNWLRELEVLDERP